MPRSPSSVTKGLLRAYCANLPAAPPRPWARKAVHKSKGEVGVEGDQKSKQMEKASNLQSKIMAVCLTYK